MKNIFTVFKREIKAYFNSPIAYIFIIVFLLISVGLFMAQFFLISLADMKGFFYNLPLVLSIFIPAVTMRLWAEDRRGNTLELLLTFPMNTYELVIGKFLASFAFYLLALLATIPVPIMLTVLGDPDKGVIACQYVGAMLCGGLFLSIGIFISGFSRDQIVSFIIAMMACFGIFFIGVEFTVASLDGWVAGLGTFLKDALAMLHHFDTFHKGVIDVRDIIYFLSGTAIFLILNAFWLESRLRPAAKTLFTGAAVLGVGIFVVLNFLLSGVHLGRIDVTEGKIYTISEASKKIIRELKAPVTVKFYTSPSEKMPSRMKTLEREVRDKLDEFKIVSKGNFDYKVFHIEPANAQGGEESLEKIAGEKGIRPFQVQTIEADEVAVKLVYSSMAIAYKEKPEEIIPQVTPQNLSELEYTLISKIYRMTLDHKPKVAIVAPYIEKDINPELRQVLRMFGQSAQDRMVEDEYELVPKLLAYEGYDVSRVRITKAEPIPEGTDTLVVIDPESLNERQLYEINLFLANGGSLFLAAQSHLYSFHSVNNRGIGIRSAEKDHNLDKLFETWGVGFEKDFLMDTETEVISLNADDFFGLFSSSQPVKMPMQIKVLSENMNRDISITSNLPTLFYIWGSALEIDENKLDAQGITKDVLFMTTGSAWLSPFHYGDINLEDTTSPPSDKRASYPLAVLLRGEFPDAFASEEVPLWPKDAEETDENYEIPREEKKLVPNPGKMVFIGCSEMFKKQLLPRDSHRAFLLNSIDAITLGEDLIGVRSKAAIDRSIGKVSDGAKAGWRFFTVAFVPLLLCILGSLRVLYRKRIKWQYMNSIS